MSLDFVPPVMRVFEDRQVTVAEIQQLTIELQLVILVTVVMAAFWDLVEGGLQWSPD